MRITISVPDDLRARMVVAKAAEHINWSSVACAAFTNKVLDVERRQKGMTMNSVAERLRLTAQGDGDRSKTYQRGYEVGHHWAQERATAGQLKRLSDWAEAMANETGFLEDAFGPGEHLHNAIEPTENWDRSAALDFWENACRSTDFQDMYDVLMVEEEFVDAFQDGALSVWNAVKDQL